MSSAAAPSRSLQAPAAEGQFYTDRLRRRQQPVSYQLSQDSSSGEDDEGDEVASEQDGDGHTHARGIQYSSDSDRPTPRRQRQRHESSDTDAFGSDEDLLDDIGALSDDDLHARHQQQQPQQQQPQQEQ